MLEMLEMMPFTKKVAQFIERHSMFDESHCVVVAVSGGPDSVALLDVLASLLKAPGVGVLHVAHFDHKLRERESADDAEFVRALASRHGLGFSLESADVREEAKRARKGIEETARELRYDFLLRTAIDVGADRIATGHTMTDQAETLLMRLVRGAGLRGLAAMRPVTRAHGERDVARRSSVSASPRHRVTASVLLVRPLLCVTREDVEQYIGERGLAYRTDPTNLSVRYTRNRVRIEVLPALRRINPRAVENLAHAAALAGEFVDSLDEVVSSALDRARVVSKSGAAYSIAALRLEPPGLRPQMIMEAIRLERSRAKVVAGDSARHSEVGASHVRAVEGLLETGVSGKRVELPGGLEVWLESGALVFQLRRTRGPERNVAPLQLEFDSGNSPVSVSGFEISVTRPVPASRLKAAIEEAKQEKSRAGRDWMIAVLDDRSLPARLLIGKRGRGQGAHVLGQRGTKKLKNLMIDHRIPTSRRADWPVVATPDGRYVWSPGLPPALDFAASDETDGLAILRASSV
ncbi:MAG TPA: tRNA lysidine(34) synthetase TilS [Blastocatellia bacterium]|nr:tRNA lysidine(34) synthetase TilS [Blastocatellia bacterium]